MLDSGLPAADFFRQATKLLEDRNVAAAIEYFDLAALYGYQPDECAAGRWNCWMMLGEFERAWQESDRIIDRGAPDRNRFWDGSSWLGRRVMLRCLHGLGDTIQFIRFATNLRQKCDGLTVQTHPELLRLLEGVVGIDRVVSWGVETDWDMQMEVTELPYAFRITAAEIPRSSPYISISQKRFEWASRCFGPGNKPRIGVAWKSGPFNPARSIPLSLLAPLLKESAFEFYSIQKDPQEHCALRHIISRSADVLDTAALISHLDLVITVDTMVAHLAGALNLPVWIMLPEQADWRWMLNRTDSPWYPSARLFRQKRRGYWEPLIAELSSLLAHTF